VEVELLVVPGCPNEAAAAALVRDVLDELGWADTPLTVRTINTEAEAAFRGFAGSPSLLVNGDDPFAEPDRAPALACRVYRTPAGLRGLPDAAAVRTALRRAVDPPEGARDDRDRRAHRVGLRAWAAGVLDALEPCSPRT
jgi:hypothetical protein